MQKIIFKPQTEWLPPEEFPDLSKYDEIAIDLETKDPEPVDFKSGSLVSKSIAISSYFDKSGKDSGGTHSV